jgi:riboflavin biosynthesis pyrimidine reductase
VPSPALEVLLPLDRAGERLAPADDERDLLDLYAHPAPRPGAAAWVRANMISSLDGGATGADGRSGSINGAADLRVFRVLRAVADVVLVGAGTVRAEGYETIDVPAALAAGREARGLRPHLELAIVTASGAIPPGLLDAERPPLVICPASCPQIDQLREHLGHGRLVVAGDDAVDLALALAQLADLGLARVLTEGGPHLLAELVTRGLVDDLCLTTSPVLVGGPPPRVLAGAPWLEPAVEARPASLLHADGVLLGRWLLTPATRR